MSSNPPPSPPSSLPVSAWLAALTIVHAGLVVPALVTNRPPPNEIEITPVIVSALFTGPVLLMITVGLAFIDLRRGHEWKPMVACIVALLATVACFVPFFFFG